MKKINYSLFLIASVITLAACSVDQNHEISGAYADIKQMQILDPMAPENNAGVVNALQGEVGDKVIKGYQQSTYLPKEGRVTASFESDSK